MLRSRITTREATVCLAAVVLWTLVASWQALAVDDVDGMCEELTRREVVLLNGPLDRPWGARTASFRDPGGHIWEIAQ